MSRFAKWASVGLVVLSGVIWFVVSTFEGGLASTPNGTLDGKGRPTGFNNVFSAEHYRIIFGNANVSNVAQQAGFHGLLCLAMQIIAMALVLTDGRYTPRLWRGFFLVQFIIFPTGILGLLWGSFVEHDILAGTADGETFTDGLPVSWIAHGVWLLASLTVFCIQRISHSSTFINEQEVTA